LAAGKGVVIATNKAEACTAVRECLQVIYVTIFSLKKENLAPKILKNSLELRLSADFNTQKRAYILFMIRVVTRTNRKQGKGRCLNEDIVEWCIKELG